MNVASSSLSASGPSCPLCGSSVRQTKNGKTISGSPQFRCYACKKTYNPAPQKQGYPQPVRQQAVKMYVDGLGFRRIGRLLSVNHQTVANWINAHHAALPSVAPADQSAPSVEVIEMDELFTFVGSKKASSIS